MEIINGISEDFKSIPEIDQIISNAMTKKRCTSVVKKYRMVAKNIDKNTIETVQQQLMALDIIGRKLPYSELVKSI